MLNKRKAPKVKENLYCGIVESLEMIESLGFANTSNKTWTLTIYESDDFRKYLSISGDYLYLIESKRRGNSEQIDDMVVLWNSDVGGKMSMNDLSMYINLLKAGNEFK